MVYGEFPCYLVGGPLGSVGAVCNFSRARYQPQGGNVQYIEGCAYFDKFSGTHKLFSGMCTGAFRLKIAGL
jgi:hypothetical protein